MTQRLREALDVTRESLGSGSGQTGTRERFPSISAAHPELRDTLRHLSQDHPMIAHLLTGMQAAADRAVSPAELERHLDGIAAITESHFRYEERQLLSVLEALHLVADPRAVMGAL